jgi:hypothetical protein
MINAVIKKPAQSRFLECLNNHRKGTQRCIQISLITTQELLGIKQDIKAKGPAFDNINIK